MSESLLLQQLDRPWLIAAWPGMGSVGAIACWHLVRSLEARPAGLLPEREFFPLDHVEVSGGIARSGRRPRSMLFAWRDPDRRRDLLIFLGEAQPPARGEVMAERLIEVARRVKAERVVTLAAIGTDQGPGAEPRVFGAVTDADVLPELRDAGVRPMAEGRITGLNGTLLAAAAEAKIPAACLLGEMPGFAVALPNPRSSLEVLRTLGRLTGVMVDLEPLARDARLIGPQLEALHQRFLAEAAERGDEQDPGEAEMVLEEPAEESTPLDPETARQIEELFAAAEEDRAQAEALKAELDRLGIFEDYEDRFLDLFRRAG
jgi:predicted ATP-grasp superfamily ATP-dependent carboligase